MHIDTELFCRALGLAIFLEGFCWAAFPEGMRRMMTELLLQPTSQLRTMGILALGFGLALMAWANS